MFLQTIYVSTRLAETADADLAEILHASRANNPDIAVTGILVVTRGRFIQALEGPAESVEPLLDFIAQDARHGGMRVIARLTAGERSFARFAMAEFMPDEARAAALDARIDALAAEADPGAARALLNDLARDAVEADSKAA